MMELLKLHKIAGSYGKTINLLNSCGILPFVWCEKHQRMSLKLPSKLWTLFQLALILSHETFLIFQTVRTWRDENLSLFDQVYVSFSSFGFLMHHMNFFVVLSNSAMHAQLVNNLLETTKEFYGRRFDILKLEDSNIITEHFIHPLSETGGSGKGGSVGSEKILIKIFEILRIAVVFIVPMTQVLIPTIKNPDFPTLFTSLLSRPSDTSMFVRFVIGFAQLYIVTSHFGMLVYNTSTLALFFFLMPEILKNMR